MSTDQVQILARELGLHGDAVELIRVLPLVYVGWSDGALQAEERAIIKEHAATLGITSPEALDRLGAWLDERPDKAFLDKGLKLLSTLLATLPYDDAKQASADITDLCQAVARAAGGLVGHEVKVEAAERVAIQKVITRLNLGSRVATRKLLRDVMELREG